MSTHKKVRHNGLNLFFLNEHFRSFFMGLSEGCLAVGKHSSGSPKVVHRWSLGGPQAVLWQSSGSSLAVIRWSSGSPQAVLR